MSNTGINAHREPWNKGKIVRQKAPFQAQGHLGAPGASAD
jgi:hypothetical protein